MHYLILNSILIIFISPVLYGHQNSTSYLSLTQDKHILKGQWDIALLDLQAAIGLDINKDTHITWGELSQQHPLIASYIFNQLSIKNNQQPCLFDNIHHAVDHYNNHAYAVIYFDTICQETLENISIDYQLFLDFNAQHQGNIQLIKDKNSLSFIAKENHHIQTWPIKATSLALEKKLQYVLYSIISIIFIILFIRYIFMKPYKT